MKIQVFYLLVIYIFVTSCNPIEKKNMNSKNINKDWTYQQVNGQLKGNASIPGTIHTDLLYEGKIEDPFYRTNEKSQQWIDKSDWEYETTFKLSDEEISKQNIQLNFQGLDTYADVYLNEKLLLKANNMFRNWEVDIKEHAKVGNNKLRVYFHSPIKIGLKLLEEEGHGYPASNDQSENGEVGDKKVSIFTRKAGYHYGWDWGPRFVTSGIWRPVVLKAWDEFRIENCYIKQPKIEKARAELIALVNIDVKEATNFKIEIFNNDNGEKEASINTQASPSNNSIELPFIIKNPKLWWSNGLGEAHLYNFNIKVKSENNVIDSKLITTGLRDIKLVRTKDEQGESFEFKLNGIKVFAKGANYIPNDSFLPRVTKENYEKVIADAVDANMNMLRIWGGGIYENDYFYELCDKNGILVWQDFMFACSMPGFVRVYWLVENYKKQFQL